MSTLMDVGYIGLREMVVDACARALFVCAYMDHCDECTIRVCRVCGEHGKAGPGEDWMDIAPPENDESRQCAEGLVTRFEAANERTIEYIYAHAERMTGHMAPPTPRLFGHYLAMQALGHGVSWSDDHPDHGFAVPHTEGIYL